MIIFITDLINTVLQSILFSYIPYKLIEKEGKSNLFKVAMLSITIFLLLNICVIFFDNTTIAAFSIHIITIIIIGVFYRKNYKLALIAYSLVFSCIQVIMLICGSIYFGHIQYIIPEKYMTISLIIFMYIPQFTLAYLILRYIDKFNIIYKDIAIRKYSLSMILIITLSMDYITAYSWMVNGNDNPLFKDVIMISAVAFTLIIVTYFSNVQKRIKETSELNKILDLKINELKKVKHDYGAQISYLYGLHLMGKYERLGELLKDIINGNNSILEAVELSNNSESVISIVMKEAVSKGINVVVDDTIDLNDISMSELEFQRIVSNIVNNSITAMDGAGLITAKTYKLIDNVIIKIQNNGPKIDDDIIGEIFKLGFSTKNSDNNGFGLAIVKEIVEKHKGTIKVKSTEKVTEFKISLPVKL